VEDHVQVLVLGDPGEQPVCDRVVGDLAGVAVRPARRELLERHVRHRLKGSLVAEVVAGCHVVHPRPLEFDRIDAAGHSQVVAHGDAVAVLLGGPAPDPCASGALAAETGG
jgi:hypothetical protein